MLVYTLGRRQGSFGTPVLKNRGLCPMPRRRIAELLNGFESIQRHRTGRFRAQQPASTDALHQPWPQLATRVKVLDSQRRRAGRFCIGTIWLNQDQFGATPAEAALRGIAA